MQNQDRLFEKSRVLMVKNQLMTLDINNSKLLECFLNTQRELFVSDYNKPICYVDDDIFEPDHLVFRPETLFRALNKLSVGKGDAVMIASAGYGYIPCLLSNLGSRILAVETNNNCISHITHNVALLKIHNVDIAKADVNKNFLEGAPFNKIFINQILEDEPSELVLSQLSEDGCLVAIIQNEKGDQQIQSFTKIGNGNIHKEIVL